MLKELAARTGNGTLVIVVMLLAMLLFGLLHYGLFRKSDAEAEAASRLPFEDGDGAPPAGRTENGRTQSGGTADSGTTDERPDRGDPDADADTR